MSPQTSRLLEEQVAPRLRSAVPHAVQGIGAEDSAELVQDGIAMAAKMLVRLEQRGKLENITPGNIAYYAVQHLKSGRRANGSSSVDIMASATQLQGSTRLHSLNEVVSMSEAGDEIFELHDVISNDREDPSVQAARKMDWDKFVAGLSKLERLVVEYLCAGKTLRQAGRSVGLCDSSMQNYRRKVASKVLDFMGVGILRDITALPAWKCSLVVSRERQACRLERQAA